MKEQGIIIFPDGEALPFGKQVYIDQPDYHSSPSHEQSFIKEIVSSFKFKLSGLEYDYDKDLYRNAINLSLEGFLFIFNNTPTIDSQIENLCYLPACPSEEQLNTLSVNNYDSMFEINNIYQFNSNDFEDYEEYDCFNTYITNKTKQR